MTIATFKKKTMAKYNNHTTNNNKPIVLFSRKAGDSKENVFTNPSSSFSINGNVRSRSYIGKSYKMSNSPGNGSSYCCGDNSHSVKPSVFSSREVMNGKKLWKKRPFTRDEIPAEYEMPKHNQLQYVCNNWVMTKQRNGGSLSNTDNLSGSQGFYVENKGSDSIRCALKSNISKACSTKSTCPPTRIGGKLLPLSKTLPHTKELAKGNPYSSSMYTRINKVGRFNKVNYGYSKPFPMFFPMSSYETCGVNYLQANDPQLLSTYYKDGNIKSGECK